jgi:indole-3-glycerol phosphate synthase
MACPRSSPLVTMSLVATYLDAILAHHRQLAREDDRSFEHLLSVARSSSPPRGFMEAIDSARHQGQLGIIAEVKRRSPSKGWITRDLSVSHQVNAYEKGGASAISVLTDSRFFAGSPEDLSQAKASCRLPVLRKDFTVSAKDVADARIMGADAILLIVAALRASELKEFMELATELQLDCLVEVHDEKELDVALECGARIVGVNQRDLNSFKVDTQRAERMARLIPAECLSVAESGIRGPLDLVRIHHAGFSAALIGESLMRSPDPSRALRAMRETLGAPDNGSPTKAVL